MLVSVFANVYRKHLSISPQNECSFVSLRDVERAMNVITWFYVNSELITEIVDRLKNTEDERCDSEDSDTGDSDTEDIPQVNRYMHSTLDEKSTLFVVSSSSGALRQTKLMTLLFVLPTSKMTNKILTMV